MIKQLYQLIFGFVGVRDLYRSVVQRDRFRHIKSQIRTDLRQLLEAANKNNPFFKGKFTEFLTKTRDVDTHTFFAEYSRLPSFTKQDYAEAGMSVMAGELSKVNPKELEFHFEGRPLDSLRRLRDGNYLMPMATGGSTSLPLIVHMTKHHMFSMLFTFFKCWYRMGWRPGERLLVFYPRNTYNIDDMVKFNRFSTFTGFRYHLFDHIDEATVRGLVDELNRFKPKLLLVFPSPLNVIAHTIRKCDLQLNHHPPLINVSGETFFDCQRKNIQSVFSRSKIEDSYGSVELGEIAHEADGGLEIFANVAYVETETNSAGQSEMIVTRLKLHDFPFIRYKMKDIANVQYRSDANGNERFIMTNIEGKDSNYILSASGRRLYPSFFNRLVNQLNEVVDDAIIEIKVYERAQRELEVQLITREDRCQKKVVEQARKMLTEQIGDQMQYNIQFVDYIDHDYRRKYRVIERQGEIEFAGGIVGDAAKRNTVRELESEIPASLTSLENERSPLFQK